MASIIASVSIFAGFFIYQIGSTPILCPNITVSWWENEPYVFMKDNEIAGTLPSFFKTSAKICCKNEFQIDWSDELGGYEAGLAAVNAQPPSNSTKDNSTFQVWVPFSLLRLAESSQKVQKEILVTNQLIVFTYDDAATKIMIFYEGIKRIFSFIIITLLLTVLFGFFIWLAETRCNEKQFPKPFYKGAYHGFWWAIVTVTTVGYGDKTPKTNIGKFIGIIWMSLGLVVFPVLTAEMSSILTGSTYSLILKKVGALEGSVEWKEASDAGALVRACKSYEHCQELLKNSYIDAMIVNSHVARPLQEKNPSLLIRTSLPKRVPINVAFYSWHLYRLKPLIDCIQKNSGLITEKMIQAQQNNELKISEEALFTTGGKSVAIYATIAVVIIYMLLFGLDLAWRWHKKSRKIGDFREGVFMGNILPKGNEHKVEPMDPEDLRDEITKLIKMQKKSISEMQTALEQIEAKMSGLGGRENKT